MQTHHFSNLALDPSSLPSIAGLQWQSLSPKYRQLNVGINLLKLAFVLVLWLIALFQHLIEVEQEVQFYLYWGGLALVMIRVIAIGYGLAADKRKVYALREHDISYRSGLFFIKTVAQPILRIQHIELKQGPLERRVDLASLQVFSAGGSFYAFELPGLSLEQAKSLRQFILNHKDSLAHD